MIYRHTMTIKSDTTPEGDQDPVYVDFMTDIPCRFLPMSGGELYRGQQLQAEVNTIIETRWYRGFLPTMIIENKVTGQTYTIIRIIEDKGVHRTLIIQAVEVVA